MPRDFPSDVLIKWMSVIGPTLRKTCSNCDSCTSLDKFEPLTNKKMNCLKDRTHLLASLHLIKSTAANAYGTPNQKRTCSSLERHQTPCSNVEIWILPNGQFRRSIEGGGYFPPSFKGHIAEEDAPCRRSCCYAIARLRVVRRDRDHRCRCRYLWLWSRFNLAGDGVRDGESIFIQGLL